MRVVVDTTCLASGVLSPFGPPGLIVGLIAAGRLSLCYDARSSPNATRSLTVPAFPFSREEVAALSAQIEAGGVLAALVPRRGGCRIADEEPFLKVALAAQARLLVIATATISRPTAVATSMSSRHGSSSTPRKYASACEAVAGAQAGRRRAVSGS